MLNLILVKRWKSGGAVTEAERATVDDRRVVRFTGEWRVVEKKPIDTLLISLLPNTHFHHGIPFLLRFRGCLVYKSEDFLSP